MKNKIRYLLPKQGHFYKANLHCHTTLSDGHWTAQQVKENYVKQGYSIVAYTDHNVYRYHKELCDDNFVALAATEINIDKPMTDGAVWNTTPVYHLNFYDTAPEGRLEPIPLPDASDYSPEAVNDYIQKMNRLGFMCCYNHPDWSLQGQGDYAHLQGLAAFELYNYGCEVDGLYGYAPRVLDDLLRLGKRLTCFAGDDNHNAFEQTSPHSDSFGAFTVVKLPQLRYHHVIQALQSKHSYVSNGPQFLELYVQNNTLKIRCSPVDKIYLHGVGRKTPHLLAKPGEALCEASFALKGDEPYVWVELRKGDQIGASSPYFKDELFGNDET